MIKQRPFTKFWFRQYHISDTVAELAEGLNGKILKMENSKYRKKLGHVLINWGSSKPLPGCDVNLPEKVGIAASKLKTFELLSLAHLPIPEYTRDVDVAAQWNTKYKVLGRDSDTGRAGKGITVYKKLEGVGKNLFYTKYFKKKREFRIHVFKGKVIFQQEKMRKRDADVVDKYIRSHDRGWCFAFKHLGDSPVPKEANDRAIAAVYTLGLDFGAVDIGWNPDDGCCIFEVNTAPGLEESSMIAYINAFKENYNG